MTSHKAIRIKQGECISSIAAEHGLFPATIWYDPKNKELRDLRGDPYVLMPGDVVHVRHREPLVTACASDQRHRFRRKGVPEKLVIQFMLNDEPRANAGYDLVIEGVFTAGTTDSDGVLEIFIPPGALKGKVRFRDSEEELELTLGTMDPITQLSGVQSRLLNLGFFHGPCDGQTSEDLNEAIASFQITMDLEVTGKLDDQTRDRIAKEFGG